jgi:hypothetical protein
MSTSRFFAPILLDRMPTTSVMAPWRYAFGRNQTSLVHGNPVHRSFRQGGRMAWNVVTPRIGGKFPISLTYRESRPNMAYFPLTFG